MRFLVLLCLSCSAALAAVPAELTEALKKFSGDPPKGWSFTQTTAGEGKSTVERCDFSKPEFDRWALVQKDGHVPTDDEAKDYYEMRSRRSRGGTAPKLTEQFDLTTLETVSESPERATFRMRFKAGETGDRTAEFLRVTLIIHKLTRTLETIELASTGEFSPTLGVRIAEMKTTMSYSVPTPDRPSMPQLVTTRLRGAAFYFKSLDADLTVTFSDYERAGKK